MQAQANRSMMAEALPTPAIPGYLRVEGGPSAFAAMPAPRRPGLVPQREHAGESLETVAGQALSRHRLIARQYRRLESTITRRTPALRGRACTPKKAIVWRSCPSKLEHSLRLVERRQRFSTLTGYNYTSYWATEYYE